jgi:hypothetical protein
VKRSHLGLFELGDRSQIITSEDEGESNSKLYKSMFA